MGSTFLSSTVGSLAGGGTLAFAHVVTLTAGGDNSDTMFPGLFTGGPGLIKAGSGTFVLAPAVPATINLSSLTVNVGFLNIGTAAVGATSALNVSGAVNLNGAAFLRLVSTPQTSAGTSGSTPRLISTFGSLNIATTVEDNPIYGPNTPVPTATLDIGGHNVLLPRGSPAFTDPNSVLQKTYQSIVWGFNSGGSTSYVLSGMAGNWQGAGIISSLAQADVALPTASRFGLAVGVWDSTDANLATGPGSTLVPSGGQPANTVLIATTVLGDANGDGIADITDLAILQNNAGNSPNF
jgi:hypothetical protein